MTASELVEKLQIIIKEKGDYPVEYMDFGEYGSSWFYPIEKVETRHNGIKQEVIGLY